jgi:hypothetical protein
VNWANPDDNFITGPNVPVGLSTADNGPRAVERGKCAG